GVVFPLGMYTACTFQLGMATGLGFLASIGRATISIAFLAWILTFSGLIRELTSSLLIPRLLQEPGLATQHKSTPQR
ncbi:MAG TPA: hypothetical protein VLM91_08990, partial [Candidatus Methylomirabilis sp.]|nr:hypothetical protein [Candidatus Methylomirabilis sp.]